MLKAILYYILLIAEFVFTLLVSGFAVGLYLAVNSEKEPITDKTTFINDSMCIAVCVSVLSMLIVWFTFYKAKFSKFSFGKVAPKARWKTSLFSCLPLFGFTLAYYAAMNLLHIHFLPKEMTEMNYLTFIPYAIVGSFFSAYVFYGAIQEELIRCKKKKWVQLLTLCLMMFPASVLTVSEEGNISWEYLGILGTLSTCYGFWIYGKTRSTIILFLVYFTSNLAPSKIESTPLAILLTVIGLAITLLGFIVLDKELPHKITLEKDEI